MLSPRFAGWSEGPPRPSCSKVAGLDSGGRLRLLYITVTLSLRRGEPLPVDVERVRGRGTCVCRDLCAFL